VLGCAVLVLCTDFFDGTGFSMAWCCRFVPSAEFLLSGFFCAVSVFEECLKNDTSAAEAPCGINITPIFLNSFRDTQTLATFAFHDNLLKIELSASL